MIYQNSFDQYADGRQGQQFMCYNQPQQPQNYYQNIPLSMQQSSIPNTMQQNQMQQMNSVPNQIPQISLNGKVVDGIDMVRATEVPMGGYGFFPRADLSEIYVKQWNKEGTTNIITFKPFAVDNNAIVENQSFTQIIAQINRLEEKIDRITGINSSPIQPKVESPKEQSENPQNGFNFG